LLALRENSNFKSKPCGISRYTLICDEWHDKHPTACMHLFGFRNYTEFKIYVHAFWPEVSVHDDSHINNNDQLSVYEKLVVVKYLFTTGCTHVELGYIYNKSPPSIGRIVEEYAPWWGKMGQNLSILSITEQYMLDSKTEAFQVNGFKNASFGVDGKDFPCHDLVSNSAFKLNQYSNKSGCSALRMLSWQLDTGLTVESTCLVGGRTTEDNLVQYWGSSDTNLIIKPVNKKTERLKSVVRPRNKVKKIYDKYFVSKRGLKYRNKLYYTPKIRNKLHSPEEPITSPENKCVFDPDEFLRNEMEKNYEPVNKLSKILESNLEVLQYYTPDADSYTKLEQVEVLLRLNELYKSGKLSYCALSHYCYFMENELLDEIKRIFHEGKKGEKKVLMTRLNKFPHSAVCVVDKGFKRCGKWYPNYNQQYYPSFLQGREQFTKTEIFTSKKVKTVRWKEEGVFANLVRERYCAGTIKYAKFPSIENCKNWALARHNLSNEFQPPIKQVPYKIRTSDQPKTAAMDATHHDDAISVNL